jgi:DNA polymerase III subunit delta
MSGLVHVFDYLSDPAKYPPRPLVVLFGEEPFLKRLAFDAVRRGALGEADTPHTTCAGDTAEWREVADELSTVALFGGRRLVFVTGADDFVSAHREQLEDYVARLDRNRSELPRGPKSTHSSSTRPDNNVGKAKATGVLVLDVATWQTTTRLYKAADQHGLPIECRAPQKAAGKKKVPDEARVAKWLTGWAASRHNVKLAGSAATLLLELVGIEFGMLDQDLAKLALFTGPGGTITPEMVQEIVGGWRAKTAFDMLDAACDGDAATALLELDRLLQSGENPLAVFGAVVWSLRRFAAATRIFQQAERAGRRMTLSQALLEAGVPNWSAVLQKTERQLKQLGRDRAGQFYRWLLEADLALKGSHSTGERARLVLELLLLRMSQQLKPAGPPPPRAGARRS